MMKQRKTDNNKEKKEFSKVLLIQESGLIWILTLSFIVLAFFCIKKGFMGQLPWLSTMVVFPWTAYGVSQAFYYRKSLKENTEGGIKFESVMAEVKSLYGGNNAAAATVTTTYEEPSTVYTENNYDDIDLNYGI